MEVTLTGESLTILFFPSPSWNWLISFSYFDPSVIFLSRIYLMGQSAGAHISSCALLEQAIKESKKEESISWSVSQIKAYFGLSGGWSFICRIIMNLLNFTEFEEKNLWIGCTICNIGASQKFLNVSKNGQDKIRLLET